MRGLINIKACSCQVVRYRYRGKVARGRSERAQSSGNAGADGGTRRRIEVEAAVVKSFEYPAVEQEERMSLHQSWTVYGWRSS